jgi:hypothetical protein
VNLPPSAIALVSLAVAGVVVYLIWLRSQVREAHGSRSMLRSIPEGIARAKKNRRHVLVFFLDPAAEPTGELVELAFDAALARSLGSFERVRVDSPKDELDVVSHVAQKYGLASIEPPTLLVLDRDGRRLDSLVGEAALGASPEARRERFTAFLERARARF